MVTNKTIRFVVAGAGIAFAVALVGLPAQSCGQQKNENGPTSAELLKTAIEQERAGNVQAAIENYSSYLDLAVETELDRAVAIRQDVRYKLAILTDQKQTAV